MKIISSNILLGRKEIPKNKWWLLSSKLHIFGFDILVIENKDQGGQDDDTIDLLWLY